MPVHIYHLKAAGQRNWPLMDEALALIDSVRTAGMDVTADIYPYIRNGIGLGSFLHPRHYARGTRAFLETLSDPELRAQLRTEVETDSEWENWYQHVGMDWNNVPHRGRVGRGGSGRHQPVRRRGRGGCWARIPGTPSSTSCRPAA